MDHQSGISPDLKAALDRLNAVPARNRRVVAHRRQEYLNMLEKLPSRGWLRLFGPSPKLAWLAVAALLVMVMLTGTTITALAAQSSLPSSLLYPVKTSLEDVQLALTPSAASQFGLLQTFTIRRFAEMDATLAANANLPLALAERLDAQFQRMRSLSASMDDPSLAQALTGLQDMLQERQRLMAAAEGQPGDPVYAHIRQRVQEMNQLASAGAADPNQFRWQHENQNGTGSEITPTPSIGPGPGAGPGSGEPPAGNPTIAPTPPAGPGAGPGPGEPPTQAPLPSHTPALTQAGPNPSATPGAGYGPGGTPTPGGGHGPGGTPTGQPGNGGG